MHKALESNTSPKENKKLNELNFILSQAWILQTWISLDQNNECYNSLSTANSGFYLSFLCLEQIHVSKMTAILNI